MLPLIGLIVYSYFAIPFMMDTIGTSLIASVIASVVTYFVVVGFIFGYRPELNARRGSRYYDDSWSD